MMSPPHSDAASHDEERWPAPVATLFIVSTSLALWGGIFFIAQLFLG